MGPAPKAARLSTASALSDVSSEDKSANRPRVSTDSSAFSDVSSQDKAPPVFASEHSATRVTFRERVSICIPNGIENGASTPLSDASSLHSPPATLDPGADEKYRAINTPSSDSSSGFSNVSDG